MVQHNVIKAKLGLLSATYTPKWVDVLRADPCAYCGGRSSPITIDHITPVAVLHKSRPGSNKTTVRGNTRTVSNSAPACAACNEAKAATTLLGYLARDIPPKT